MFLIPTSDANDWRKLLADPDKHWKRECSAFELAHRWSDAGGFPPEVAALLDQDDALVGGGIALYFGWATGPLSRLEPTS